MNERFWWCSRLIWPDFQSRKQVYNHKHPFVCLSVCPQNPRHPSSFIHHFSSFILHLLSFIHHLSSCIFHLLSSFSACFGTTNQHSSFNTFHGFIKPFKKCISETVYQLTYHSQSHSQHHLKLLRINSRGNCSSWSRDKLGVRVERKLGQPCTNIWWKWV